MGGQFQLLLIELITDNLLHIPERIKPDDQTGDQQGDRKDPDTQNEFFCFDEHEKPLQ